MELIRKKYKDIFQENADGTLTLQENIVVNWGVKRSYEKGKTFGNEGLDGINFHQFRYLDVGVDVEGDVFEIKGFFANSST